jgi:hypothetical protein
MKNNKLLICVCFYYIESRLNILKKALEFVSNYDMDIHIIVDTNSNEWSMPDLKNLEIHVHTELQHPYNLTFMHRKHIIDNIDNYDWFMYIEDDMGVPYNNFKEFVDNFYMLWPVYVPAFIRVESFNDKEYVVDVLDNKNIENCIEIGGKKFFDLSVARRNIAHAYHAFWIMPQKELKETMYNIKDPFFRISTDREWAASFTTWKLEKIPLVRIDDNKISKLSYSYHLSNNYSSDGGATPVAKIEVDKIFSI